MSAEMTYGHLGRSGLLVSRIGLGTMNFGFTIDESTSFAVMDTATDAGINFFDTADVYGGLQSPDMEKGYGISDETIGRWLRRSAHRDDIVLATKVYQPMGLGPNDRRLSANNFRALWSAQDRLSRLGVIKSTFDVNKHIEPKHILNVMAKNPELFSDLPAIPAESRLSPATFSSLEAELSMTILASRKV
jgi:hypothetical protein